MALGLRCGGFGGVVPPLPDAVKDGLFLGLERCGLIGKGCKGSFDCVKAGLFGGVRHGPPCRCSQTSW